MFFFFHFVFALEPSPLQWKKKKSFLLQSFCNSNRWGSETCCRIRLCFLRFPEHFEVRFIEHVLNLWESIWKNLPSNLQIGILYRKKNHQKWKRTSWNSWKKVATMSFIQHWCLISFACLKSRKKIVRYLWPHSVILEYLKPLRVHLWH